MDSTVPTTIQHAHLVMYLAMAATELQLRVYNAQ